MDQRLRAPSVESGAARAKDAGCHGWSLPFKYLDYLDYNNLWVIPMSHALVYGVMKGFWKLLLTPPPSGTSPWNQTSVFNALTKCHNAIVAEVIA